MKRLQSFLPVSRSSVSRRQIHRDSRKASGTFLALPPPLPLFEYGGIHVGSIGVTAKAIEGLLVRA